MFDEKGRMFKYKRAYRKNTDTVYCPTKGCSRNKNSYSLEIRGSDYCDECGATMILRKEYDRVRVYL